MNGDHTLTELSEVVASQETMETVLTRVVESACRLVPDCTAASVTLVDRGRPTTPVHTDPTALALDSVQYRLGSGPCLEAINTDKPVLWFADDGRWPALRKECRRRDVAAAVLSVPLASGEFVLGGLNLYSRRTGGLADDLDRSTIVLLAEQAAIALATSLALEEQRRAALTLQGQLLPVTSHRFRGMSSPPATSRRAPRLSSAATGTTFTGSIRPVRWPPRSATSRATTSRPPR